MLKLILFICPICKIVFDLGLSLFINHNNNKTKYTKYDATICMIDICNYTRWCEDKESNKIFNTMLTYNKFILNKLKEFDSLEKIELVGDSVMIIGGVNENNKSMHISQDVIDCALCILEDIPTIQKMFNDNSISIRIGIHKGEVCSGFIPNPRKLQVFGNAVNIASRIESKADNGACNISNETLENMILNKTVKKSRSIDYELKGINNSVACTMLTHKRQSKLYSPVNSYASV